MYRRNGDDTRKRRDANNSNNLENSGVNKGSRHSDRNDIGDNSNSMQSTIRMSAAAT
jgi:hypothetical protein